jgi:hypothetical protein
MLMQNIKMVRKKSISLLLDDIHIIHKVYYSLDLKYPPKVHVLKAQFLLRSGRAFQRWSLTCTPMFIAALFTIAKL